MKNKKSKIIVPALALILLSTAASISGSVAWFTASRTANIKTGNFAVVNTGDNLAVKLEAVAGVAEPAENSNTINPGQADANHIYALTDASFDHTNTTSPYVVEPNVPRTAVLKTTSLGAGNITTTEGFSKLDFNSGLVAGLGRGTNVYSAFIWNMTFSITFSESSTYSQGLFLDLSKSYMHEAVTITEVGESLANLYDEPDLSGNVKTGTATEDDVGETYYKAIPDSSGKGFRIAFVPTGVTANTNSKGYAKVWAAHESGQTNEGKYVSGHGYIPADQGSHAPEEEPEFPAQPATLLTPATAYSTNTISFDGAANGDGTFFDAVPSCAGAYMNSTDSTLTIPADNTLSDNTALSGAKNYLGVFGVSAGQVVEMQFTCIAWFEGTNPNVDSNHTLESITTSLEFGVCNLNANA